MATAIETRADERGVMLGNKFADWPLVIEAAQQADRELAAAYRAIIREHQATIPLRIEREWDGSGTNAFAWWTAYIDEQWVAESYAVRITETPEQCSGAELPAVVAAWLVSSEKEEKSRESLTKYLRGLGFTRLA